LLNYNDGNGVFCWVRPEAVNEDPRPAELELRESLEAAVEDDSEEMATSQLRPESQPVYRRL
jgi:hypothetical protein